MTDDTEVRELVTRLSRPSRGGGHVIERAAMLAEGSDFRSIEAWILQHGGEAEATPAPIGRGLFVDRAATRPSPPPTRYLLPAGALE
ncbi:MAG: hypothetical protein JWP17_2086 [Solirubrobacterales bacterium]|jgi:hypothetical protein|nr:hypothetical protein [Solirubrobacterales bacterium]